MSTGTDERPVVEVSLNDKIINITNYNRKISSFSPEFSSWEENAENSDKSMLQSAKNIDKPITVVYKNPDGELSHIKTYYPDGTVEVAMSKEQVESGKVRKLINENLDKIGEDLNKLNFIKLAAESLDSREKLEQLKNLIKGMEIILGSK